MGIQILGSYPGPTESDSIERSKDVFEHRLS